jgi:hypothetical protein
VDDPHFKETFEVYVSRLNAWNISYDATSN